MDFQHAVILVTAGSAEDAARIAGILLEARKVACVNILPEVDSHFRWEGSPEREREALMVIKTRADLVDDVTRLVREHHPYDVPEVIALPIIGGNADYLRWIDEETDADTPRTDSD